MFDIALVNKSHKMGSGTIFILARMLTNFNNYFVVVFADEL